MRRNEFDCAQEAAAARTLVERAVVLPKPTIYCSKDLDIWETAR